MPTPAAAHLSGQGTLHGSVPTQLSFFEVTGYFNAVADPSVSGNLNSPVVQTVNALVTFTPRLLRGQQMFISNYLITPSYNAEQTINLIGNPNGGTFTLSYGGYTTTALAFDATPTQVHDALVALTSIGSNNVTVVADVEPQAYDVLFTNNLGYRFIEPITGDGSLLTNPEGAGFCEVTVTVTALGSPEIIGNAAVSLPPLTARIANGVLSTIDYVDTPGFQLASNIAQLNLGGPLIYDVSFSNVTFNGASQYLAPFAFTAPTDTTPVCLTSPTLDLLPYQSPSDVVWTPPNDDSMPLSLVGSNWRQRALNRSA
jgi:hypothetical protein